MVIVCTANERISRPRDRGRRAILLVDPRPLARDGLARTLNANSSDLRVIPVEHPGAVDERGAHRDFAVILLNIAGSPIDAAEVVDTLAIVRSRFRDVPVAVLSDREDSANIVAAIESGMRGYLPMRLELPLIVKALRLVAVGGTFVPAELVLAKPDPAPPGDRPPQATWGGSADPTANIENLTPRQLAVLEALRTGKSNKAIASDLALPESVVKSTVRNIMRKLGAANRTEVAMRAPS